jgi:hypothetical protein
LQKTRKSIPKGAWKEEDSLDIMRERKAAREAAEEAMVQNDEERKALLKARKTASIFECVKDNDKDSLESELLDVENVLTCFGC